MAELEYEALVPLDQQKVKYILEWAIGGDEDGHAEAVAYVVMKRAGKAPCCVACGFLACRSVGRGAGQHCWSGRAIHAGHSPRSFGRGHWREPNRCKPRCFAGGFRAERSAAVQTASRSGGVSSDFFSRGSFCNTRVKGPFECSSRVGSCYGGAGPGAFRRLVFCRRGCGEGDANPSKKAAKASSSKWGYRYRQWHSKSKEAYHGQLAGFSGFSASDPSRADNGDDEVSRAPSQLGEPGSCRAVCFEEFGPAFIIPGTGSAKDFGVNRTHLAASPKDKYKGTAGFKRKRCSRGGFGIGGRESVANRAGFGPYGAVNSHHDVGGPARQLLIRPNDRSADSRRSRSERFCREVEASGRASPAKGPV